MVYKRALFLFVYLFCSSVFANQITSVSEFKKLHHSNHKVPVIVTFKAEKIQQATAQGWMSLGSYIQSVQARGLNELGWQNFNNIVRYQLIPAIAKSVSKKELKQLLRAKTVDKVFEDRLNKPSLFDTNASLELPKVIKNHRGGEGQTVAIIDTGVDANHPFLRGKVVGEACFSQEGSCPGGSQRLTGKGAGMPCEAESCSHGTHVAGIVAGKGSSNTGVAPDAKLLAIQVFSLTPLGASAYDSDVMQALEWVYKQRNTQTIAAINISLGGGRFTDYCDDTSPLSSLISLLYDADIATIVASGNDGSIDGVSHPACLSEVISVGSLEKNKQVSDFSNTYSKLSLLAPGGMISSSIPGGGYEVMSGTSMAAPHVAGAWALFKSNYPRATIKDIQQALSVFGANSLIDERTQRIFPALNLIDPLVVLEKTQAPSPQPQQPVKPKPDPKPECKAKRVEGILIESNCDKPSKMRW